MNKERRKVIDEIIVALGRLQSEAQNASQAATNVLDEEQEAFDNLPESLQDGDKGMDMQTAIDNLENAISLIDDIDNMVEDIVSTLEDAKV